MHFENHKSMARAQIYYFIGSRSEEIEANDLVCQTIFLVHGT